MNYHFAPIISESDHQRILNSPLFTNWIENLDPMFRVSAIQFDSADFVMRKGEKILLFLKLKATVSDENGKRVPGIVMLRGNAVAVLVVLWCEGKPYLLLVDQPRLATGTRHSLEIVAGILDWSRNWKAVALAELEEEAGLHVEEHELIDLQKEYGDQDTGIGVSCGLLDERIYLAALERNVSPEELRAMDGRDQTYTAEDEGIRTVVMPYEKAAMQFTDSKGINALFLYERWLEKQGKKHVR